MKKDIKSRICNFSIGKKIFLSFFIIILLYGLFTIVNYYQVNQVRILSEEVIPHSSQMEPLQEIATSLKSIESNLDKFMVIGYEEYQYMIGEELEKIYANIEILENLAAEQEIVKIGEFKNLIERLGDNINSLSQLKKNIISGSNQYEIGDHEELTKSHMEISNEINEMVISIYQQLDSAREYHTELSSENAKKIEDNILEEKIYISKLTKQFIILGFIIIVLGILLYFYLTDSILKPISKLENAAIEMSKGQLDTKVNVKSQDELGNLASIFNKMVIDIKNYTEKLKRMPKTLEKKVQQRTKELTKSQEATISILEDLQNTKGELEKANRLKTDFLNITSHELRTPLTPIRLQLEMLEDNDLGKLNLKQKESVDMILKNIIRLHNLINGILTVTKIDSGKYELEKSKSDIKMTITETVNNMEIYAQKKNISLAMSAENIPLFYFDKDKITEVLINLLNNAVKFTPEKGKIIVTAIQQKKEVVVSVKDSGIGIKKQAINELFKPFSQVDSSVSRKYGGTGLGLSICKSIVELHRGKMGIKSEINKGTTFEFTLPFRTSK